MDITDAMKNANSILADAALSGELRRLYDANPNPKAIAAALFNMPYDAVPSSLRWAVKNYTFVYRYSVEYGKHGSLRS